jgi:hypothetical protein
MDAERLLMTWEVYEQRALWLKELSRAEAEQNDSHAEVAKVALAQLREVSPLEALQANSELVHLMMGRRWPVILDARERGASWAEIGESLGMSAATVWSAYLRAIELQEKHVRAWHESDRARVVLDETYTLRLTPEGWRITVSGRHHTDQIMEWRVAPSDVHHMTAQQRAERLLWDLERGVVHEWVEPAPGADRVYIAKVRPTPVD